MTRYFLAKSGNWYRFSSNGRIHVIKKDGIVRASLGGPINLAHEIETGFFVEKTKEKWIERTKT